jgi:hypothetical protein
MGQTRKKSHKTQTQTSDILSSAESLSHLNTKNSHLKVTRFVLDVDLVGENFIYSHNIVILIKYKILF